MTPTCQRAARSPTRRCGSGRSAPSCHPLAQLFQRCRERRATVSTFSPSCQAALSRGGGEAAHAAPAGPVVRPAAPCPGSARPRLVWVPSCRGEGASMAPAGRLGPRQIQQGGDGQRHQQQPERLLAPSGASAVPATATSSAMIWLRLASSAFTSRSSSSSRDGARHQLVADQRRRGALYAQQGADAQAVAQLLGGLAFRLEGPGYRWPPAPC